MIDNKCNNSNSLGSTYVENLDKILNNGFISNPRQSEVKEILAAKISGKADENQIMAFENHRDLVYKADNIKSEAEYLIAELFWYFSGSDKTDFISKFGSIWELIKNKDYTINSNYGRSVFYTTIGNTDVLRYDWILNTLIKDSDTRQAILPYTLDRIYSEECGKDFTCTQLQHFFIRNKQLHSIVYIRSSDAVYGLSFDIPWWSLVQQKLFYDLKKANKEIESIGNLEIFIGSSHIYKKHYELCENLVKDYSENSFKSIRYKDIFNNNHRAVKELDEYLINTAQKFEELDFFIEKFNKLNIGRWFFQPPIPNVTKYSDRSEAVFYLAKRLMHLFITINSMLPKTETTTDEFKKIWFNIAKDWFNLFFEIY